MKTELAPFKFRAASNGKVFTRQERIAAIEARHHGEKVKAEEVQKSFLAALSYFYAEVTTAEKHLDEES